MKSAVSQKSLQNEKTQNNENNHTSPNDLEPMLLDSEQHIYHLSESITAINSQYKY